MPLYTYKARDKEGILLNGSMEAESERGVIDNLDRLGYSPVEINRKEGRELSLNTLNAFFERFKPIKKRDVILFTRQLAALLRSGTALSPSLAAVCEQTANKKFRSVLEDISRSVQKGESFSEALSKYPAVFSEFFISMVSVAEAGGLLDKVLERLAAMGRQEMEMSSRITSALVYPLVLVAVAFVIVNFLVIGVLPKFAMVFNASGAVIPLPTKVILGLSWVMRKLWLPLSAGIALALIWFKRRLRDEGIRERFHRQLLKMPIFGELYTKIQISRFSRVTSALITSGIPILQALDVVERTITNLAIRRAIKDIKTAIVEGQSLTKPFKASGLFSPLVTQLISTGEKSGNLDQMLREISGFYDPEIEYTIKNLTSLLEPFMLLAMGGIVGFIALSVLLPIFNLIKVFRG